MLWNFLKIEDKENGYIVCCVDKLKTVYDMTTQMDIIGKFLSLLFVWQCYVCQSDAQGKFLWKRNHCIFILD